MSDFNDYFDELIDVDEETEAEEYSGDDGDEEGEGDDEFSVLRTAVLTKDGMLALLSLKTSPSGGQIVRFDPREPLPSAQSYESEEDAVRWFNRSLATSRKNGWSAVYDGEPLLG